MNKQPKYKEGNRVIFNTQDNEQVEVIIIEATCFDSEYQTWYYKALSTITNEVVYVEEMNLTTKNK